MTATYRREPINIGDRIPGTELTVYNIITPRRCEFRCDCGNVVTYPMSIVETGERKSCGCGKFKRRKRTRNNLA